MRAGCAGMMICLVGVLGMAGWHQMSLGADTDCHVIRFPVAKMGNTFMLQYACHRVNRPPNIDGELSELAWQEAQVIRDFGQIDRPNDPPALYLEARALWDPQNLYLAFVADASPVPVTMTDRNDALFNQCAVELFVACDDGGYYEVEFNPLNTVLDLHFPAGANMPWPELAKNFEVTGLRSAVNWSKDQSRWTLEAVLPFGSFPAASGKPWRVNFARSQCLPDDSFETATWAPVRSEFADVRNFGILQLVE